MTTMNLDTAAAIVEAASAEAARLGVPMTVAVCDGGGHLVSFARMDGCMLLAIDTVQAKARAAVYFRRPTAETVERSRRHPTVYQSFVAVATAPIVLSMGGLPLWTPSGDIAGAVAAAGGTGEEDIAVAAAGAAVWEARLSRGGPPGAG
jgi:uncharacterized protein GlcG (DUF336 family)